MFLFNLCRTALSAGQPSEVKRLLQITIGGAVGVETLLLHRCIPSVVRTVLTFVLLVRRLGEEEFGARTKERIDFVLRDPVVGEVEEAVCTTASRICGPSAAVALPSSL